MKYDFIRDADVEVIVTKDEDNHPIARAVIDGKYIHHFDSKSRVSKSLDLMTPADLSERLTGGHFFFVEGALQDFRDGHYTGFVQDDNTIAHLNDLLGINSANKRTVRVHENTTSKQYHLGRKWSDHGIKIDAFNDGGEFTSELHFGWSPFVRTINSAFMLYRLVCSNGMRGLKSFMNTRIPLVNRWEEHLEIANKQIQNKVEAICDRRFTAMANERASVGELLLLAAHIEKRGTEGAEQSPEAAMRLINLGRIVNPRLHLADVYRDNVFKNKAIAAQYPSHLTTLDAYNIATEIRSHTRPSDKSTARALDYIANDIVFDHKNIVALADVSTMPKKCSFSDPDAAFFGLMN